jgi:Aspartyl protease
MVRGSSEMAIPWRDGYPLSGDRLQRHSRRLRLGSLQTSTYLPHPSPTLWDSLTTVAGTLGVRSVILPGIEIGPVYLHSSRVIVQDRSFLQREFGVTIAPVAGLDILQTRSWMIDFEKRRIVFVPPTKAQKSVRFETQNPCVTVKLEIGGQDFRLTVDSGTGRLLLYRSRIKRQLATLEPILVESDSTLVGPAGSIRAAWYRTSRVKLGKIDLGARAVLVVDADARLGETFDGLLGLVQVGFRRVWLDFENGIFAWE